MKHLKIKLYPMTAQRYAVTSRSALKVFTACANDQGMALMMLEEGKPFSSPAKFSELDRRCIFYGIVRRS